MQYATRLSSPLTLVLLPVVVLLAACSRDADDSDTTQAAERRTPIAVYEVSPRDLSRQVRLSASVRPRFQIAINSRLHGSLVEVLAEEGDRVEQGQLLARFDVQEESVELQRAESSKEEARLEYQRLEQLLESRNISDAELQRARAAYEVARAEQQLWQTRVDFGSVRAPQNAVVTARHIEPGEVAESQQPLFELGVMEELVLLPGISERDVRHLRVGQVVPVQLDALPERTFNGRIRRIFPMADATTRMVTIEIALPEDSFAQGVRPGYLGRIPMVIDARPDTIAVPAAAVGEGDDGHYIYVVEEERLVRREVTVGITRGQWTEIEQGLSADELVLASNPIDMAEGTAVRIVGYRG
ncbi:efflux RND transporter periplasmic adaptor subunit [Aliidiomarina soli]|uniref:Efflux RND transporter periplasmic adaptor subunit n=1 Tax=Aliidiomarina soli TaxID=1928574 RepID=A0A432WE58_9GAMM|nr:efflux RND transporter periplasmic adaptor subunit [Aliidiomarina soli]RUO31177.1 efflux RND transporter periplasmic adaptor subunit [Aliidiomarina soli]